MKLLTKVLLLIIVSINFTKKTFAQKKPKNKTIIVYGKIRNFDRAKNDNTESEQEPFLSLRGFKFDTNINFNKKTGDFRISLENCKKGNYILSIHDRYIDIYLDAKNDLFIDFNSEDRTSKTTFKGENQLVLINNYLQEKKLNFINLLSSSQDIFLSNEENFIREMDTYKAFFMELLNKSKLPKSFKKLEKNNIYYAYLRKFQNYEIYHSVLIEDDNFKASRKILKKLKNSSFNKKKLYLFSVHYRNFISKSIESFILKHPKEIKGYSLYIINKKIPNKFIKDELLFKAAKTEMNLLKNCSLFYKKYISYISNETYKQTITKIYTNSKRIQKGQASPKFKNYQNSTGNKISLDDLLNKKRYIYIQFWSNWCGFCKQEIAYINNFNKKYKGTITFVGINVDTKENHEKWKKTISSKEMNGVQLFSGKNFEELDFAKQYLVRGLPRFILLEPDGTIISNNAPRLSNEDKLNSFLKKLGITK